MKKTILILSMITLFTSASVFAAPGDAPVGKAGPSNPNCPTGTDEQVKVLPDDAPAPPTKGMNSDGANVGGKKEDKK